MYEYMFILLLLIEMNIQHVFQSNIPIGKKIESLENPNCHLYLQYLHIYGFKFFLIQ